MSEHTIRPFSTIEDYKECVALQEETWGHGFSERVSPAILKVAQILGGVAAGAYGEDGRLDGFVFGMTGVRDGEVVHWSDMLAVRRGLRDHGLGARLKAYQRRVLLERRVSTMYWTFDPLRSRNAHLNFSKLGIVVREYREDMYGQTDSPLHRGIGTDRYVALWLMESERVRGRVDEGRSGPPPGAGEEARRVLDSTAGGDHPVPGTPELGVEAAELLVAIPADVSSLMSESMGLAVRWREATRAVFTHYLERGWEVRELLRAGETSDYLLIRR